MRPARREQTFYQALLLRAGRVYGCDTAASCAIRTGVLMALF